MPFCICLTKFDYSQNMTDRISIVKIGGAFLEEAHLLERICQAFAAMEGPRILVHGGGKRATEVSKALGIVPKLVEGRRITDAQTLEVVTMVYAGWANKTIVSRLQSLQCNALGVSGADANLIRAVKRPVQHVDYGFVGDVKNVDHGILSDLLQLGLVPVFCAITHDGRGQLLNTNADTIAASLAASLSKTHQTTLYYCFEKEGVLEDLSDPQSVIPLITSEGFRELKDAGVIDQGMIPKIHNGLQALRAGVAEVCIGSPGLLSGKAGKHTKITL